MSKAPDPVSADSAAPAPKNKKMLFIIVLLVILLVLAIAAAGFLLLKSKHDSNADEEDVVEEKPKPKKKGEAPKPPAFVTLDPAFTVNLVQEQFLQVAISLRIEDAHEEGVIKGLMPQIRNNILRILATKSAADLYSAEGKDKLAEELTLDINRIIEPPVKGRDPEGPVMAVLFTSFIIQ